MHSARISLLEGRYRGRHPARTLLRLFSEDRLRLTVAAVAFLVKTSPVYVYPIITAGIIDFIASGGDGGPRVLLVSGAIILALTLQNIPGNILYDRMLSGSCRRIEAWLRGALVRRLQQLDISFHDTHGSGRIQAKVLRDVEAIETLARQLANNFLSTFLGITIALGVTLYKEPRVVVIYLLSVPIALAIHKSFWRIIARRHGEFRREVENMSARVGEMVEMAPVTRAHGVEDYEVRAVDCAVEQVRAKGMRVDLITATFSATAWATLQIFQYSTFLITAYFAVAGSVTIAGRTIAMEISVGEVVLYQAYFMQILGSVSAILAFFPQLARGFESIRSIGEILECPDIERNEGRQAVERVDGAFRFERVGFVYPGSVEPALCSLDFSVAPGEHVAVVGESGSGKSTLMKLIVGFHRPTEGRILLDGRDMETLDLRTYRRHLAVVPQRTILFSGTMRENITYGLDDVPEDAVRHAVETANLAKVVAELPDGLETRMGERGSRLSGGQAQRVSIARAIVRDPRVIILDEATSALDVASELEVQEALERLIQGRTTFVVAHRLSTIRNAHRVLVFDRGRCVESGTHEELLELGGRYQRLRSLQV